MTTELPVVDVLACCAPLAADPLGAEQAEVLARRFKALADPVRLRLLSAIASRGGGEVCVCDLSDGVAVSGPTVSHHLRVLREAGLIDGERRGTWVYYRVVPGALSGLAAVLQPADAPVPA